MEEKKYYSIGQVSNVCKIPIKTLRYYDEIELLVPKIRKETSNYRYYSKEQLVIAVIIRQLRVLGFNLKDIKEIIRKNRMDSYIDSIHERIREIDAEIISLEKKRRENLCMLSRFAEGRCYEEEEYRIENIPKLHLLTSRSIIKSYHNEEVNLERWISVLEKAENEGLEITGPIFVTFYTEMFGQFISKDCDIEFAIQVAEAPSQNKDIHSFGGFTAATTVYQGRYEDIFKRYIALKRWIDENGYEICGKVTEEFLISPLDTANMNEHVTKIIVPVKITGKKK